MYVKYLNGEIVLVLNVTLLCYRDLNLQNDNKMTSIQDFAIISSNAQFTPLG